MKTCVWQRLSPAERSAVLARPALGADATLSAAVAEIVAQVRAKGDAALRELTAKLDRVELGAIEVGAEELAAAEAALTETQRAAIRAAAANIETFHRPQLPRAFAIDTVPGCALRARHKAHRKRGALRARRQRAPALHGAHAWGAGAHRGLRHAHSL